MADEVEPLGSDNSCRTGTCSPTPALDHAMLRFDLINQYVTRSTSFHHLAESTFGRGARLRSDLISRSITAGFGSVLIRSESFSHTRHHHSLPRRTMGSLPGADPVRVLIVGGCYAGISTAVNLLDLGDGLQPRMARPEDPYRHHEALPRVRFEITIVDERDGYCTSHHLQRVRADQ